MPCVLTIDIGNTRLKAALFEGDSLRELAEVTADGLAALIARYQPRRAAVASVAGERPEVMRLLRQLPEPPLVVTGETAAPLRNAYERPDLLGADRWAAAVGARVLHPRNHILVVDAGTCVTIDLVSAEGVYLGGNISPGVAMRLRAMHEQTARLPLLTPEGEPREGMGRNTQQALRIGAWQGLRFELQGYADWLAREHSPLHVCLSGGTPLTLPTSPHYTQSREEGLVHVGLNAILHYHEA